MHCCPWMPNDVCDNSVLFWSCDSRNVNWIILSFEIDWNLQLKAVFSKCFGGHKSFLWGHLYPRFELLVTSALGFKALVDSLVCMLHCLCTTNSSVHLWYNTYWPLGSHHGSQAVSFTYVHLCMSISGAQVQDQACHYLTACAVTFWPKQIIDICEFSHKC